MLKISKVSSYMASVIYGIQQECFRPLLLKYKDYDINPSMESIERIVEKIQRPDTDAYIFNLHGLNIGWVRVTQVEQYTYMISALCILPEFQNRGYAQYALKEIESYYPKAKKWILNTILEEDANLHLYEKLGYTRTGEILIVNQYMTIIDYEKNLT